MKIEIKISNDTLIAVNSQLKKVYTFPIVQDKEMKIVISMVYDIADKFDKKCRTRLQNQTIFDVKKRIKITLKFHEAWAMYEYLDLALPTIDNQYHKTLIEKINQLLHQKLC